MSLPASPPAPQSTVAARAVKVGDRILISGAEAIVDLVDLHHYFDRGPIIPSDARITIKATTVEDGTEETLEAGLLDPIEVITTD